jgi:uncharacterized protein (DUF1810 family)
LGAWKERVLDTDASADDPFNLRRFIDAQAGVIEQVRRELTQGRKTTHWMWFVFPQLRGLGFSAMAQRYAIVSLEEARAYLGDPVLGPRLRKWVQLVNAVAAGSAHDIFGSPDDLKFHACVTLFDRASGGDDPFAAALGRFFAGKRHDATDELLHG